MKTINKSIEMIATFADGIPRPYRFRIVEEDELKVFTIKGIVNKRLEKIDKKSAWIYNCYIDVNEVQVLCELRYLMDETRWVLYRI